MFVSCRCGAARTTAFRAGTGTVTRISPRTMANSARPWTNPSRGLLKDLKARGLLDDTIVYWTTEFGRMPCSQGSKGRDHNPFGFTSWLAGGGIQRRSHLWRDR